VEKALYLPLAADPDVHRPLDLTPATRRPVRFRLSFVGAGYPNRRLAFRELAEFDLKIWGSDWDGEVLLAPRPQLGGRRVDTEESVRVFNAARINLNLHSGLDPAKLVPEGDFVNPRTFELAMCGAFQLVSDRTLLPEVFSKDEVAVFDSMEGLKQAVRHYLAHPGERAGPWPPGPGSGLCGSTPMRRAWRRCAVYRLAGVRISGPGRGARPPFRICRPGFGPN
jgi:spore maturation protein CgeB